MRMAALRQVPSAAGNNAERRRRQPSISHFFKPRSTAPATPTTTTTTTTTAAAAAAALTSRPDAADSRGATATIGGSSSSLGAQTQAAGISATATRIGAHLKSPARRSVSPSRTALTPRPSVATAAPTLSPVLTPRRAAQQTATHVQSAFSSDAEDVAVDFDGYLADGPEDNDATPRPRGHLVAADLLLPRADSCDIPVMDDYFDDFGVRDDMEDVLAVALADTASVPSAADEGSLSDRDTTPPPPRRHAQASVISVSDDDSDDLPQPMLRKRRRMIASDDEADDNEDNQTIAENRSDVVATSPTTRTEVITISDDDDDDDDTANDLLRTPATASFAAAEQFRLSTPASMGDAFQFSLSNLLKSRRKDDRAALIDSVLGGRSGGAVRKRSSSLDGDSDADEARLQLQLDSLHNLEVSRDEAALEGYLFQTPRRVWLPRTSDSNTVQFKPVELDTEDDQEEFVRILCRACSSSSSAHMALSSGILRRRIHSGWQVPAAVLQWLLHNTVAADCGSRGALCLQHLQWTISRRGWHLTVQQFMQMLYVLRFAPDGLTEGPLDKYLSLKESVDSPSDRQQIDTATNLVGLRHVLTLLHSSLQLRGEVYLAEQLCRLSSVLVRLMCDHGINACRPQLSDCLAQVLAVFTENDFVAHIKDMSANIALLVRDDHWTRSLLLSALPQSSSRCAELKCRVAATFTWSLMDGTYSADELLTAATSLAWLKQSEAFDIGRGQQADQVDYTRLYFTVVCICHTAACLQVSATEQPVMRSLAQLLRYTSGRIVDNRGAHPDRTKVKDILLRAMLIVQGRAKVQRPATLRGYAKLRDKGGPKTS